MRLGALRKPIFGVQKPPTIAVIAAMAEKKNSAIMWKPLSSDLSDNDRWDRTFYISAIVVAAVAGVASYDR